MGVLNYVCILVASAGMWVEYGYLTGFAVFIALDLLEDIRQHTKRNRHAP